MVNSTGNSRILPGIENKLSICFTLWGALVPQTSNKGVVPEFGFYSLPPAVPPMTSSQSQLKDTKPRCPKIRTKPKSIQ